MQTIFKKATRYQAPDDIITARFAPFGSFAPAEFLNSFFETLTRHQTTNERDVVGGFVFGGVFADEAAGRKPKDYDIYISSPAMVAAVREYLIAGHRGGFDDDENEGEWAREVLGEDFPVTPHEEIYKLFHSDMLGDYFEFSGAANINGAYRKLDIKIGTELSDVKEFLCFTPAPIMAAAMTLGSDDPEYAYHRDFVDHTTRGILCTQRPDALHIIEKANRKGLTLCTPEQLAAQDMKASGAAPAMTEQAAYKPQIM